MSVEKSLASREGLKRGWLTYSELLQLLPSFTLARFILNHLALVAVSYAASLVTISGAILVATHTPATVMESNSPQTILNTDPLNASMSTISTTTTMTTTSTIPSATSAIPTNVLNDRIMLPAITTLPLLEIDSRMMTHDEIADHPDHPALIDSFNFLTLLLELPKFLPLIANEGVVMDRSQPIVIKENVQMMRDDAIDGTNHYNLPTNDLHLNHLNRDQQQQRLQGQGQGQGHCCDFMVNERVEILPSINSWSTTVAAATTNPHPNPNPNPKPNHTLNDQFILPTYRQYFIPELNKYCHCVEDYMDVYLIDNMTAFLWHLYSTFSITITRPFLTLNFM